jgi:hypothetical protein
VQAKAAWGARWAVAKLRWAGRAEPRRPGGLLERRRDTAGKAAATAQQVRGGNGGGHDRGRRAVRE